MPSKFITRTSRIYDPVSEAFFNMNTFTLNHIYQVTPGFNRKRLKPLPVNSRTLTIRKTTGMGGFAQRLSSGPGDTPGRPYAGNSLAMFGGYSADYDLTEVESLAQSKATGKLYSELGDLKVNAAVNAAEFGQVINSVLDKVGRVASARANLRRGRWGSALTDLGLPHSPQGKKKPIANQWLELQYGWLPLLSDAYESLERFVSPGEEPSFRVTAQGTMRDKVKTYIPNIVYAFRCSRETEADLKCSVRYIFDVIVTDPSLRNAQTWGLTNPLLVAWELVPYSFLIDWFLPVGKYLESLTATQGLGVKTGVRLVKKSCRATSVYKTAVGWPERFASGEIIEDLTTWTRTQTGFPERALPRLKSPVSWLHVANATALIRQKMR